MSVEEDRSVIGEPLRAARLVLNRFSGKRLAFWEDDTPLLSLSDPLLPLLAFETPPEGSFEPESEVSSYINLKEKTEIKLIIHSFEQPKSD